ncbi:MAG: hypothetical protein ACREX3_23525 [Gammaproteobacteria bacterium]
MSYPLSMVAHVMARTPPDDLLARFGFAGVGAFLFSTGFRIFPASGTSALATITTFVIYGGAFLCWGFALIWRGPYRPWTQSSLAIAAVLGLVASVSYGILYEIPNYGTDVIALAHAGGEVLLDGVNPYSVDREDVLPILDSMNLRDGLFTQTLSGEPVPGVIYYPGLHVLAYTVFVAAGVPDLRWATLVFELAALTVIWFAISPRSRWLIPTALLLEPYLMVIFTSGGVTDWLWVLPLSVAAVFLHKREHSWAGLWLGLACAVKQQPWFVVPFMTIWIIQQIRGKRENESSIPVLTTISSFLGMVGLGFLLPNLPFILWSPGDWAQGVLGPALLDLVPDGQGVTSLVNQGVLNLTRTQFGVMTLILITVLSAAFFVYFDRAKHMVWLLPPVVLFFAYRSLHSYFVFWLPVAAMWLDLEVTERPRPNGQSDRTYDEATHEPSEPSRIRSVPSDSGSSPDGSP